MLWKTVLLLVTEFRAQCGTLFPLEAQNICPITKMKMQLLNLVNMI